MAGANSRRPISTGWPRVRCASPSTMRRPCPACRRGTTSYAARGISCGGPGARSRSGKTRSPIRCARRVLSASSSAIIRTCSRRAAKTTTSTSPPGTISAAMRAMPGRQRPIRPGRARRISACSATCLMTSRAAISAVRRISRGRARCRRRRTGSPTTPARMTASSCSSTSSIRTSRSIRQTTTSSVTIPIGMDRP